MPEPLALEATQRFPQLAALIANDVIAKVSVRATRIAVPADALREVEYESDRQTVEFSGKGNQRLPRFRLHIRGVNNRELPGSRRFRAMKCRTSKASFVAAWSFSSSDTSPRQKSEEITSAA